MAIVIPVHRLVKKYFNLNRANRFYVAAFLPSLFALVLGQLKIPSVALPLLIVGVFLASIGFLLWIVPILSGSKEKWFAKIFTSAVVATSAILTLWHARGWIATATGIDPNDFPHAVAALSLIAIIPVGLLLFSVGGFVSILIIQFIDMAAVLPKVRSLGRGRFLAFSWRSTKSDNQLTPHIFGCIAFSMLSFILYKTIDNAFSDKSEIVKGVVYLLEYNKLTADARNSRRDSAVHIHDDFVSYSGVREGVIVFEVDTFANEKPLVSR